MRLYEKIALLRQQMRELKQIREQLKRQPDKQLSLTDPDSRSMNSGGKRAGTVGYNVQAAVDMKHHLIVEHEVTNVGGDHGQQYGVSLPERRPARSKAQGRLRSILLRGAYSLRIHLNGGRHGLPLPPLRVRFREV